VRRLAAVLACALTATAAGAQLSDTEQRIVAAVRERSPGALELLERSVRINSGTLNTAGVRETGELFRAELEALGFSTRWATVPESMRRAGHLVATREGSRGKRLLLMGHIDTVFEKESTVAPWDPRGARVRGQGVVDMKGGIVVMVEALRALQAAGALEGSRIAVVLTGDEERVGRPAFEARAEVVALARASDAALSFEGSTRVGDVDGASISRRASGGWTLRVTARPGHAARVGSRELGYGAIFEGARILEAFRTQVPEPGLTLSPGLVLGGTEAELDRRNASGTAMGKNNVIAKDFIATGNLRYLRPEQGEQAKARMREIVAASLPHAQSRITFSDNYPPMPETPGSRQILEAYSQASVDAGLGPIVASDPDDRGAGDISFVAPYIPGLDGLGPQGSGAHTDEEDVDVASIERSTIRAAILIYRLTR
jgi:glutamate carboxypeptidase